MAVVLLTTVGAGSWTVPAGVTSVQVECWGGGGMGLSGYAGGGGAYAKKNALAVTPGASISYFVARGGDPTVGGAAGAAGQATWFSSTSTVFAEGGTMGIISQPNASNGKAANSIGDVKYSGGSVGSNGYSGLGGGASASPTGNGGSGGLNFSTTGGTAPGAGSGGGDGVAGANNENGGGGGGGSQTAPGGRGGAPGGGGGSPGNNANTYGGRGQIRITYDDGGTGTPAPTRRAPRSSYWL